MHPILAEILRCKDVPRLPVLRLWQQQIRQVIVPLVDAGEQAQQQQSRQTKATRTKEATH